jgi:hydrogenase maturation protein HypF
MTTRVRAKIVGRVQGVGFRPTVYRYATQLGLAGFVCNGNHGVTLEVEGEDSKVGQFFSRLTQQPPRQALIAGIQTEVLGARGYRSFEVVQSDTGGEVETHISPDLATCEDCRREIFDATNRRRDYAFTNCTNCGPRFTLIRDLPYDRPKTSMATFAMCEHCEHEYDHPGDRRFHAQPNACPVCGPQLELRVVGGLATADEPLAKAQELLRRGRIVAIKSLGGYHLACDAFNPEAVARLRQRKQRPDKAFAVMFRDLATVKRFCELDENEEAELLSDERPIVVLRSKTPALQHSTTPDAGTIGAFLPYTPLHHLLLKDFVALVMTSGNLTDEPIISTEEELKLLEPIADAVLTHNRPIVHKCDDSVVRVVNGQRQFLRRARGFVPNPIRFAAESPQILAVGGELKNTFCLARGGNAFLSQHIGDLKDYRTHQTFEAEISEWQRLMRVVPEIVAYDLHPGYLSTKFAERLTGVEKIPVQHHHAHIASVLAEHDLHEPVIGVALDGTGFGPDGTVWGGEFLVADRCDFERLAHFKQYAQPGGDKAVEEPWRMAASVMLAEGLAEATGKLQPIQKMIAARFNSPLTSSAGRLFDAVAAMLGLRDAATYEAQAAIRLEAAADRNVRESYAFAIAAKEKPWKLSFDLRAILNDKRADMPVSWIAGKFHNTVAAAVVQVCRRIREQRVLNRVALSGGVFQNELLLRRTVEGLQAQKFEVFTNQLVPPNDGGLALGQIAVAAERKSRSCA